MARMEAEERARQVGQSELNAWCSYLRSLTISGTVKIWELSRKVSMTLNQNFCYSPLCSDERAHTGLQVRSIIIPVLLAEYNAMIFSTHHCSTYVFNITPAILPQSFVETETLELDKAGYYKSFCYALLILLSWRQDSILCVARSLRIQFLCLISAVLLEIIVLLIRPHYGHAGSGQFHQKFYFPSSPFRDCIFL